MVIYDFSIGIVFKTHGGLNKLISKINYLIDYVDEIVIVDSGPLDEYMSSKKLLESYKKVSISRSIGVGYEDPILPYAISMCRSDWILKLQTTELPNFELLRDLYKIIQKFRFRYSAFKIMRVEHFAPKITSNDKKKKKENSCSAVSYQIALFKNGFVRYTGFIHQQPIVNGRLKKLPKNYYLDHDASVSPEAQYEKIKRYLFLEIFVGRIFIQDLHQIYKGIKYIFIVCVMFLMGNRTNSEISIRSYKVLYFLQNLSSNKIRAFYKPLINYYRSKVLIISSLDGGLYSLTTEISRLIYRSGGPINYLRFNDPRVVDSTLLLYGNDYDPSKSELMLARLLFNQYYIRNKKHVDINTDIELSLIELTDLVIRQMELIYRWKEDKLEILIP